MTDFEEFAVQFPVILSPTRMRPVDLGDHQPGVIMRHALPARVQGITAAREQGTWRQAEAPAQVLPAILDRGRLQATGETARDWIGKHDEGQLRCSIAGEQRRTKAPRQDVINEVVQGFGQPDPTERELNPKHPLCGAGLGSDQVADPIQREASGVGFAPCRPSPGAKGL
jgi:hypothetical protein